MVYELKVVIDILFGIGTLCGLLWLYFRQKDAYQTDEAREDTRKWYYRGWERIIYSRPKELPKRVVAWIVGVEKKLVKWIARFARNINGYLLDGDFSTGIFIIIYSLIASYCSIQVVGLTIWALIYCSLVLILISILLFTKDVQYTDAGEFLFLSFLGMIMLWGLYFILQQCLNQGLVLAFLVLFLSSPILGFCTTICSQPLMILLESVNLLKDSVDGNFFSFAASISFSITILALIIGNIIAPDSNVPQTAQMLLINVLFDSFTLLVTFSLLRWSLKGNHILRIPAAIASDILIAALFACCSLYFGLLKTAYHLSFIETFNILLARSPEGTSWELGPYFWAMHTTFIPTLIYLSVIFFAIVGKRITLPLMMRFLKATADAPKPHYATGTTFGLIGGMFLALATFLNWYFG